MCHNIITFDARLTNRYEVFGDEAVLPVLSVPLPPPLALVLSLLPVALPLLAPLVLPLDLGQLPLPRRQTRLGQQQLLQTMLRPRLVNRYMRFRHQPIFLESKYDLKPAIMIAFRWNSLDFTSSTSLTTNLAQRRFDL